MAGLASFAQSARALCSRAVSASAPVRPAQRLLQRCASPAATSASAWAPASSSRAFSSYPSQLSDVNRDWNMLTDALKATMPLEDLSSKRGRRGNQSNVHDHARKAEAAFENRREFGTILPGTPTTGRSREVSYNDVAGAYRQLMAILRRNEVRKELRLGDRYEKPNQERRRKKVQLVMAIKARGS